jgi:hypothetical protein
MAPTDFLWSLAVAAVAILAITALCWVVGVRSSLAAATGWRYAFAAAALISLISFVNALRLGHLLELASASEKCAGTISNPPTSSFIPPSYVCYMADGTSRELVPPWASAWLVASLVFLAVGLVGLCIETYRNRSDARDSS